MEGVLSRNASGVRDALEHVVQGVLQLLAGELQCGARAASIELGGDGPACRGWAVGGRDRFDLGGLIEQPQAPADAANRHCDVVPARRNGITPVHTGGSSTPWLLVLMAC